MALPADDRSTIRQAQAGDPDALAELVARYGPEVRRMSRAVCVHADNADEVSQETLLALVQSLRDFRGESALTTWLFAVARHACLKCRRRSRANGLPVTSLETLTVRTLDGLVEPGSSPEEASAHGESLDRLHAAIRALEPAQREVLVLRDVAGVGATEAARALGISVSAVKSRLHRARAKVRAALQGDESGVV